MNSSWCKEAWGASLITLHCHLGLPVCVMAGYQSNLIKLSQGQLWLAHWFNGDFGVYYWTKVKANLFYFRRKRLAVIVFFCCSVWRSRLIIEKTVQWQIQDFPRGNGAKTPGGANIWFCQIFQKTALNWKNLDRVGASKILLRRSATAVFQNDSDFSI